jgi:ribosomal protein L16/L10AE
VQRIEVTQKTESFEDMMKALKEAQAQMPKPAEVVDVEAIEEAD